MMVAVAAGGNAKTVWLQLRHNKPRLTRCQYVELVPKNPNNLNGRTTVSRRIRKELAEMSEKMASEATLTSRPSDGLLEKSDVLSASNGAVAPGVEPVDHGQSKAVDDVLYSDVNAVALSCTLLNS